MNEPGDRRREIAEEVNRRAQVLADLKQAVNDQSGRISDLVTVVEDLEQAIALRPTAEEVSRKRRTSIIRVVAFSFWLAVLSVQVHDLHVETCANKGLGAAAEEFLTETTSIERLQGAMRTEPVWFCGISFPTHSHYVGGDWPTTANLIGIGIYSSLAVVSAVAVWRRW